MNNLFLLDELGEPISEGDVVIFHEIGWIVVKIEQIRLPEIIDPKLNLPQRPKQQMIKLTLAAEFSTPVMAGSRVPKVYKSSKRMNPQGSKDLADS
jgi:hypothetical protein